MQQYISHTFRHHFLQPRHAVFICNPNFVRAFMPMHRIYSVLRNAAAQSWALESEMRSDNHHTNNNSNVDENTSTSPSLSVAAAMHVFNAARHVCASAVTGLSQHVCSSSALAVASQRCPVHGQNNKTNKNLSSSSSAVASVPALQANSSSNADRCTAHSLADTLHVSGFTDFCRLGRFGTRPCACLRRKHWTCTCVAP
jgi:hypothetical protein